MVLAFTTPAPTYAFSRDDGRAYEQRWHFGTGGGQGASRVDGCVAEPVQQQVDPVDAGLDGLNGMFCVMK
jgi:hypothetical protein